MINKFFYFYLLAGTVALILFLYQLIAQYKTGVNVWNLLGDILLAVALYYLAFKTYHEKKDKETM